LSGSRRHRALTALWSRELAGILGDDRDAGTPRGETAAVDGSWRPHHDYDDGRLTGGDSVILINIKMQIRPEKADQWLALADSYARDVNSEDGCLFFQFARSLADEHEFVCIEGFKDAEAGATHVKQPYVKAFFDAAPDLVSAQPQIIYIDTPHDGFGPMGEIQPR
jgi:quinol monooxygenase YgiN